MKKLVWVLLLLLIPLKIFGQIKVDQVGDDWQPQIYKALELIKETDTTTYSFVLKHCDRISFWSGEFSTVEGESTITISQGDMRLNSIENLFSIIYCWFLLRSNASFKTATYCLTSGLCKRSKFPA